MGSDSSREQPHPEYFPDNPEQIEESVKRLGPPRVKVDGAFLDAIARVNQGRKESNQPPMRTRKCDSEDDVLPR